MSCNCEFDKDNLISDFQLGLLDNFEEQRVRKHLENCEACRQTLAELNSLTAVLESIKYEPLPVDFKEKLHANLIAEQKKLYSNSEPQYEEKAKTNIFLQMFPLRRFVPIAAVVAVAVLLSGKFGLNESKSNSNNDAENTTIAVNRVNPNVSQEFKAYSDENKAEVVQTEEKTAKSIKKIEKSDTDKAEPKNSAESSDEIQVAINNNFEEDNAVKAIEKIIPQNENDTDLKNEESAEETSRPVELAIANQTQSTANSVIAKSVQGDKISDKENAGRAVSSSLASGGGGGSSAYSAMSAETEQITEKYSDEGVMTTSLERYVNVYSVEKEKAESLGYAEQIKKDGMIYLSNEEYKELCNKLGEEPKFVETRLAEEECGYDALVIVK